ncbi:MAG: DUF4350 domain-containing protein, partial [Bacteroidetes bacterium]|nr:DUF4350 domain-containing protein [Bacteroidota bacterium]
MRIPPQDRKYVIILVATLLLAVAAEWMAPEPIDWSWSLERDDTRPYGATIAYDVLPDLFPGATVDARTVPPYLVLRDTSATDVNYLFLSQTFAPDAVEARKLLAFAERGNALFISAASVRGALADSLGLTVGAAAPIALPQPGTPEQDSLGITFVNPTLQADNAWTFPRGAAGRHFTAFDTSRTTVLGVDEEGRANYVRIDAGGGQIFVHLVP